MFQHLPTSLSIDRLSRLGIRARLLLLVAALGVPFLVYLVTSVTQNFRIEQAHVQREVLDTARLTAARLDDQLGRVQLTLGLLGPALGPVLGQPDRVAALLRGIAPELSEHLDNVAVWDRAGRLSGALHPEAVQEIASIVNPEHVEKVLATAHMVVTAPIRSRVSGELTALFAAPARVDDQPVGVVVVSIRLERLHDLLDPGHDLHGGGVITLFDETGTIVSRSLDPARWVGQRKNDDRQLMQRLRPDRPGAFEVSSFDGVQRIFGYAAVKTAPWTVFVGLPTTLASTLPVTRLRDSLVFGSAMLLAGLLLATWAARSIALPLSQLEQDAERLGRGDLTHRNQVRGMHEIASLAGTLNRTAQALEQQTRELQASKALLRKVTDHLPALVSLLDRDERFLFANRAYRDWLTRDPETLVGRSLEEVYGNEVYDRLRPHLQQAWAGQRTVYERRMATTRGDLCVEATLEPRLDGHGQVIELCVMILDVTERRHAQDLLARSEERLSLAIEGSGLALFDWDIPGDRIYHSAQASVLRGGPPVAAVLTPAQMHELVHPDDIGTVLAQLRQAVDGETGAYSAEFRVRTAAGGWTWVRRRGRVVERDADGRALRLAGTDVDITQRRQTEARLRQLAEFDALTGLPNRALFTDRLQLAVQDATRNGRPMAVMFIDVDHFKQVNDSLGHEAGDDLLKVVAQRLAQGVRTTDTVARLAGDEFTVILEGLHDPGNALSVAQHLVDSMRAPVALAGQERRVSISIGVAIWAHGEIDAAELLRSADRALYEAKRQGRDRCQAVYAKSIGLDPVQPAALA